MVIVLKSARRLSSDSWKISDCFVSNLSAFESFPLYEIISQSRVQ
jgi:hypothetical protein